MAIGSSVHMDIQTLASLDDREIQALMSVIDADSISNAEVRAHLEARLNASLVLS